MNVFMLYNFKDILLPVSVEPLREFMISARQFLKTAFMPSLGAITSLLNYQEVKEKVGHFNTPLCHGPPMAGKRLAAACVVFVR